MEAGFCSCKPLFGGGQNLAVFVRLAEFKPPFLHNQEELDHAEECPEILTYPSFWHPSYLPSIINSVIVIASWC